MISAAFKFLVDRLLAALIFNPRFLEWLLLFVSKRLVESTATPHDDAFLAKIEELLKQYDEKKA